MNGLLLLYLYLATNVLALYVKRDTSSPSNVSDGVNNTIISGGYDPVVVIDRWPNLSDADLEQKTKAVKTLSEGHRQKREVSCNKRALLDIVPYYDDAFFNRFGTESEARIRAVIDVMQIFLELDSLKFQVYGQVIESFQLNILEIKRLPGIFSSDDVPDLYGFGAVVKDDSSKPTAHHYMLFTSQNNRGGVVGIAFMGTTCAFRWSYYQTSVVEYWYNDVLTGEVAAHELGHSLGADHDFTSGGSRYDSQGNTCTNVEGIMDYVNNPTRWTTCSNEDFEANFRAWGLCFPLEDTCTTTRPTTTTTTPTSTTTSTTPTTTTTTPTSTTSTTPTTTTTTPTSTTSTTPTTTTTPTSTTSTTPTTTTTPTSTTSTTPTTTTTTPTSTTSTTPTTTTTTPTSTTSSTTPTTTTTPTSTTSTTPTTTTTPTSTTSTTPTTTTTPTSTTSSKTTTTTTTSTTSSTTTGTTTPTSTTPSKTTTTTTSTSTSSTTTTTTPSTAPTTTAPVCSCEKFQERQRRRRCCKKRPVRFGVNCCAGCGCR